MDFSPLVTLSQEEFLLFHKMDRDLYRILVMDISRDPSDSMQILALLLWLEIVGFQNVVEKIVSLPNVLINEVASEAILCLNSLNNYSQTSLSSTSSSSSSTYVDSNDIPLLQSLITEKEISLKFFHENRDEAIQGIEKTRKEICSRALIDIMQQAMMRNTAARMVENSNNLLFDSIGPSILRSGSIGVQQQNNARGIVPADDRTLFVTFSKGYRVEEWEVREFFSMAYGDCIEALFMQDRGQNEQSLFARIIFHEVNTIDLILRGASKAKFSINGKHVWARKFVPKRGNASRVMISGETSSGFGV